MTLRSPLACPIPAVLAAVLLAIAPAPAAAASGWLAAAGAAGFAVDGDFSGLHVSCREAGAPRLVFGPFAGRFDMSHRHAVIVDVDGTAFRMETRAMEDAAGGTRFVRAGSMAEFAPLVAALRAGRAAEVSSPAGRFALPLRGSGKALAALEAACR
ncbi:hypothetical protein [Aurantimonas sp. Leaf443]|uniref:hypothetical protein n=1 Tax=Aurantimonas sp. Leaf443 TaxID=1736378 RepID=UPI0006FD298E|nr:hypothetical protein [Aurantimonas sp. Leaf443]KQT83917.1 hypothetical protein ASG48_11030 [Aurantimonas sp. Leaf443]